jgi:5'-methylthioadenosine phosphorylase
MQFDVAVIGGTGVGSRLMALGGSPVHIPTPLGTIRGRHLIHEGVNLLLLSRHSAGHKVPPHLVNYAGMATALKQLGIRYCLATAAVGSLNEEWGPGTFVVCSDFYDFTYRNLTLFNQVVEHRDFSHPFSPVLRNGLKNSAEKVGKSVQMSGVYAGLNGPRYETPAEIQLYKKWGIDLVGMTGSSEAVVMREAGVEYSCLAIVTNLAAGLTENMLSHEEVVDEMERSGEIAVTMILDTALQVVR